MQDSRSSIQDMNDVLCLTSGDVTLFFLDIGYSSLQSHCLSSYPSNKDKYAENCPSDKDNA